MIHALFLTAALAITPTPPEVCAKPCAISPVGVELVARFEGFSPYPYKDVAGLLTIGYGHLITPGEVFTILPPAQARELLIKDLATAEKGVNRSVRVRLFRHQFDALCSFAFNVGTGALKNSTLLKKVNAEQHSVVPEQFLRWVNAGGRFVRGLMIRRQAEAELYRGE